MVICNCLTVTDIDALKREHVTCWRNSQGIQVPECEEKRHGGGAGTGKAECPRPALKGSKQGEE